jgi:Putative S-adenosyl-L-methionine-dependent methyltransferase
MAQSRTISTFYVVVILGLCIFCYILGSWKKRDIGRGDLIALTITKQTECAIPLTLNFETHHARTIFLNQTLNSTSRIFEPCDEKYTDYTPCQDQKRAVFFPRKNMVYRERHCPSEKEKMHCLIPAPKGYVAPFHWPMSRDYVQFANVPYRTLTVKKGVQNWIQFEGNVFRFPGGGTQFPLGADQYIDQIASVVPIENGTVRTVLDTGCGVCGCLSLSLFLSF